jgi:hypothetical protein
MANVDRPRGFTPIKFTSGAPWSGQMRAIGVTDAVDLYVGDMLNMESGLAAIGATNDTAFLGVAVGFGKRDPNTGYIASAANPDELETIFYDDSGGTHTDYVVFYVPANDMIFSVQSADDMSAVLPGAGCDLVTTHGGSTVGRSGQEVGANTNTDFFVVEKPEGAGIDQTVLHATQYITVNPIYTAFHA